MNAMADSAALTVSNGSGSVKRPGCGFTHADVFQLGLGFRQLIFQGRHIEFELRDTGIEAF